MPASATPRFRATLTGALAVLLWAGLALLTAMTGAIPPFQLTAMTFLLGGLVGLAAMIVEPRRLNALFQRPAVWMLGVGGLFGYHFLYFTALKSAPPAQAGLIAYLWPLLIVLFSAAVPGERLRAAHIIGAFLGFSGTAIILLGPDPAATANGSTIGYAAAFGCALVWSLYSVLSRRFADVPSDAVAGFCIATSILSALCHFAWETTVWPASALQWLAVVGLGLGPVGLAFYAWDHGVKHGDIRLLGILSYAAPPLSTLVLVAAGLATAGWPLAAACLLITLGAALPVLWRAR